MNKQIISHREFTSTVSNICRQIIISNWRPDYIVGLTRGGLFPAVMMSHYFNVPMQSLNLSFRDGGTQVSDCGMAEDAFGYNPDSFNNPSVNKIDPFLRKKILIVDDINDTGKTFEWLINDWQSNCLPNDPAWQAVWNKTTKFAVLVNNESSNFKNVDYSGILINKLEKDVWIEFPWENWWHK